MTATKAEFVSTVSARRTLGRREISQIIVCRPRHRSFSPPFFLTTMLVNGWSRGAGIYPAASDRSITQRGRRMECPSARRIRRCGTVHGDCFSFRYVPALQAYGKPAHVPAWISLSAGRKDGCPSRVNRERSSTRAHEAAQEYRSLSPAMHVPAKCDDRY